MTTIRFFAERRAAHSPTDEDAAMSTARLGPFPTKDAARHALAAHMLRECLHLARRWPNDEWAEHRSLIMSLVALDVVSTTETVFLADGLRFAVWSVTT